MMFPDPSTPIAIVQAVTRQQWATSWSALAATVERDAICVWTCIRWVGCFCAWVW